MWLSEFVKGQINKWCVRHFEVMDTKVSGRQFSLMHALYALLFIAVLMGIYTGKSDASIRGVMVGAYILWGLIEAARYISIKRSQGRIS